MIQHVKRLCPELHVDTFRDASVLVKRCIPAEVPRSDDGTAGFVAGTNLARWHGCECRCVEPFVNRVGRTGIGVAHDIRTSAFERVWVTQAESRRIARE